MKGITGNERGAALLLVIMMTGVIIAIALRVNLSARSGVYGAANMRDAVQLRYLAKSGFHAGAALLLADTNNFDSYREDWAQEETIAEVSAELFDDGYFTLNIGDEEGKIPLHRLVTEGKYNEDIRDLMLRFLMLPEFGLEEEDARDIIDAIKDWIDGDDELTGFGAENLYYECLERPYRCKNGPLDCVDELVMIKGITRDLLYGTDTAPGIAGFLTVFGSGKININTAPTTVLRALSSDITDDMAADLDEYRQDEETDLASAAWYRNVPGMATIAVKPELISVKSETFRIGATAHLRDMERSVTGILERTNEEGKHALLSWEGN